MPSAQREEAALVPPSRTTSANPSTHGNSPDEQALWAEILEVVRQNVHQQTFETWFHQTRFLALRDRALTIQGPNQFFVDWLTEHHLETLRTAAHRVLGRGVEIEILVDPEPSTVGSFDPRAAVAPAPESETRRRMPREAGLNQRYVFSNFVVGDNNRLAHAACEAVAEQLAQAYNPLFLYGGVGLGKTHLMQAIGNEVLEREPQTLVHYVSAENFMNELIQSIRTGKTFEFKNRYRNVDLLLIDDIQFLAGKETTQQEFFHTFNALYDANKQIVVTCDRPPKEIPTLEERLRSRFEWGLITDLQAPKLETRIAILKKKVEKEEIVIPDDVLVLIAERVTNNIRELEGALIRLLAFASLTGSKIHIEMAKEVLGTFLNRNRPKHPISLVEVTKTVAGYYDISLDLLRSKTRTRPIAHARQIAMYLCRELTGASLNQIGMRFGGRDHTTVHHAWQKITRLEEIDPDVHSELEDLIKSLHSA
jgi:chromosomal replication initiator protein